MEKKSGWFLFVLVLILFFTAIFFIYKNNISQKQDTNKPIYNFFDLEKMSGCRYIYKTKQDYFDYAAAIEQNKEGSYQIVAWPVNFNDIKLTDGYVLGSGACISNGKDIEGWIILDVKKSDLNMDIGFPGCMDKLKKTYPECFDKPEAGSFEDSHCIKVISKSSDPNEGICTWHPIENSNIIAKDPFIEFYVCPYSGDNQLYDYNGFIVQKNLADFCLKLI